MNAAQIIAAEATKAIFFNVNLEPVVPLVGDWFCEMDWDTDFEGDDFVREGSLVEYLGEDESHTFAPDGSLVTRKCHRVMEDDADSDREPRTLCLIRQNY